MLDNGPTFSGRSRARKPSGISGDVPAAPVRCNGWLVGGLSAVVLRAPRGGARSPGALVLTLLRGALGLLNDDRRDRIPGPQCGHDLRAQMTQDAFIPQTQRVGQTAVPCCAANVSQQFEIVAANVAFA